MNDRPLPHPLTPPDRPDPGDAAAPTLPSRAAVPPWTDQSAGGAAATSPLPVVPWTSGGAVPPPPPPPPPPWPDHGYVYTPHGEPRPSAPLWQGAASRAQRRPRSSWMVAGAATAILGVAFGGGFLADRLASSPSTSPGSASTTPFIPGTSFGGGSSGSSSSASADPSGVAAKVTPGIVNVNVSLDGGAAAGTGMVITSTGEVLTNNHVIDGETSIRVELPSTGRTYSAHVLGWDPRADVALIQVDGGGSFTTVSIGDSSTVSIGETVVALGNALGRNGAPSVTTGNVTALNRSITASDQAGGGVETVSGLIQVSAQIQPGDSGGPLVTGDGTVIGMDTAAQVNSDRFNQNGSSVAYAIPINNALAVVRQIQSGRATTDVHIGTTRALLGVGAQDAPGSTGVVVQFVQGGSAAAKAGIIVGSLITALDGQATATNNALRAAILSHRPGDSVSVTWTDPAGQGHTASVTLASGPPA